MRVKILVALVSLISLMQITYSKPLNASNPVTDESPIVENITTVPPVVTTESPNNDFQNNDKQNDDQQNSKKWITNPDDKQNSSSQEQANLSQGQQHKITPRSLFEPYYNIYRHQQDEYNSQKYIHGPQYDHNNHYQYYPTPEVYSELKNLNNAVEKIQKLVSNKSSTASLTDSMVIVRM